MKSEFRNVGGTNTVLVAIMGNNIGYPMAAIILNNGPGTVYLGAPGVTTSNGFPLASTQSLEVDMVNEGIWAVGTVTTTVNILRRGD